MKRKVTGSAVNRGGSRTNLRKAPAQKLFIVATCGTVALYLTFVFYLAPGKPILIALFVLLPLQLPFTFLFDFVLIDRYHWKFRGKGISYAAFSELGLLYLALAIALIWNMEGWQLILIADILATGAIVVEIWEE
jgi:hypothetical protein